MEATKGKKLYEGKAKEIWSVQGAPDRVLQVFKDEVTAFDGAKRGRIRDKGLVNCQVSAAVFRHLEAAGIATHYLACPSEREMLVRSLQMLPVEVVVRNEAQGSIVRRYGLTPGLVFDPPLVEFFYKSDAHHDPLVTRDLMLRLGWVTAEQAFELERLALQVNRALLDFFGGLGIRLVDFKLEFGLDDQGRLILGDEISPDSCRLVDAKTGEKLDKDVFRFDLADPDAAYAQLHARVRDRDGA